MPPFTSPSRRRAAGLALVLALGVTGLAACGDDDDASSESSTTTTGEGSPEDVKAPMAEVLAGLPGISEAGQTAASAAEAGDFDAALAAYEALHEIWEEVEGTIKDTDLDTYEAIETAQGLIKDGAESENAERVAQGAADQTEAIEAFIAANG